jgi:hypothetical protein
VNRVLHARSGFRLIRSPETRPAQQSSARRRFEQRDSLLTFSLILVGILIPHLPLLTLPYFWDEAGYYIPAAHDLLVTGAFIPHSTISNAHPPLVMAYLAAWWKLAGFAPLVTRMAMLVIAAFTLTGVYRLARLIANREVAAMATICTALFPVFFAQSTLAHLDLAAAAFTIWGLEFYIEDRRRWGATMFTLAALTKETAIIAPLALLIWEVVIQLAKRPQLLLLPRRGLRQRLFLAVPLLPLAGWFALHFARTGYLLGNPGFFHYNVAATLTPLRFLLALGQRLWQLLGYLNLYVLTLATLAAMFLPPLRDGKVRDMSTEMRQRIAIPTQLALGAVVVAYLMALSLVGGAVLARYLLPVYPLWIIICVSTLRRRVRMWWLITVVVCLGFVLALVGAPFYRIAPEDTLAYRDFVELQNQAAHVLAAQHRDARVLTAWPATDELTRPYLGYVEAPLRLASPPLDNFSAPQVASAQTRRDFDLALIFATKYEPSGKSPLDIIAWWRRVHERWFDYHVDLAPEAAAAQLHAHIVWSERRGAFWAVILQPDFVPQH